MLFKLSNLNSNLALNLGYFNPALNNSAKQQTRKPEYVLARAMKKKIAYITVIV